MAPLVEANKTTRNVASGYSRVRSVERNALTTRKFQGVHNRSPAQRYSPAKWSLHNVNGDKTRRDAMPNEFIVARDARLDYYPDHNSPEYISPRGDLPKITTRFFPPLPPFLLLLLPSRTHTHTRHRRHSLSVEHAHRVLNGREQREERKEFTAKKSSLRLRPEIPVINLHYAGNCRCMP